MGTGFRVLVGLLQCLGFLFLFVCIFLFYFNKMLCSLFRAVLEKQVLLGAGNPLQWEILNFMSLVV